MLFAMEINQAFVYQKFILMLYSLWNNEPHQDKKQVNFLIHSSLCIALLPMSIVKFFVFAFLFMCF